MNQQGSVPLPARISPTFAELTSGGLEKRAGRGGAGRDPPSLQVRAAAPCCGRAAGGEDVGFGGFSRSLEKRMGVWGLLEERLV